MDVQLLRLTACRNALQVMDVFLCSRRPVLGSFNTHARSTDTMISYVNSIVSYIL
jgi:hypothetical protein